MSRLFRAALSVALLALPVTTVLPAQAMPAEDPPVLGPPPVLHYPDVAIAAPGGAFVGRYTRETARQHAYLARAGSAAVFRAEVCNRTGRLGRITLLGTASGPRFRVKYTTVGGVDITGPVVAGTYGFRLAMDQCVRYRIIVRRTAAATEGNVRTFGFTARPADPQAYADRVGAVAHAQAQMPHGPCVPDGQGGLVCP